jgi:hypothetical protein
MSDYIAPQADRITTVATVVDAIAAGCDTAESIAAGINMDTRQGSYYPHAAATLGYVSLDQITSPATWSLTSAGATFAGLDAPTRATDLTGRLAGLDELDTLTGTDGDDALLTAYLTDYSPETARRRVQSMRSWADFLALTAAEQTAALSDSMAQTSQFAPAAADALWKARRAQAAAQTKTHGETCMGCFEEKSLTGACGTCD